MKLEYQRSEILKVGRFKHSNMIKTKVGNVKEGNVTGQLGWQGKAQSHHKNWIFFQPGITHMKDYHDSCDLIWKITFGFVGKNLGHTLNFNQKKCAKLTPKHVACPVFVIYWKIPHDHLIPRSKFSYLTIGKYQKDRHLEISRFLKSTFLYLTYLW